MTTEYIKARIPQVGKTSVFADPQDRIVRFTGFTHIVGKETVAMHTFNARRRAATLPISHDDWLLLDKTLEIHDAVEIFVGDQLDHLKTAHQVQDEDAAVNLLAISPDDKQLIYDFNSAKQILLGGGSKDKPTDVGVLATMIDFVDAAELFHIHVPAWADSHLYKPADMPPDNALMHAIKLSLKYGDSLRSLEVKEETTKLSTSLLAYCLDWIVAHWGQVPRDRVPKAMKKCLSLAKKRLGEYQKQGMDVANPPGLENFLSLNLF